MAKLTTLIMQIYITCLPHSVTDLCRVAKYSLIVRVLNKCKTKRETALCAAWSVIQIRARKWVA